MFAAVIHVCALLDVQLVVASYELFSTIITLVDTVYA